MALVALNSNGEVNDPANLDAVEKGQSGKVTGVILPPPEIRAIVDKTAQFVAKNGKSFEEKILKSPEGQSTKFNFMRPHDPYNSYYEFKIKEFEEGGGKAPTPAAPAPPPPPPKETEETKQSEGTKGSGNIVKKQQMNAIARALTSKPKTAPPPYQFTLVHPTGLSAMDLDIIKMTAQYTAVSGRQFLAGLAQREQRNPQFDFLKPTHMLFSYFTALVDAYSKILTPQSSHREFAEKGLDTKEVLQRVVHRWEYERQEEEKKAEKQAENDRMERLYQNVDWHDFVIVETISFPEDEVVEPVLAPSTGGGGDDMDMEMDEDEDTRQAPPPPPKAPAAPTQYADDDEGDIKIVSNYRPSVMGGSAMPETVIDPITKRPIKISEMSEHMRIQLMDPKWRAEQKRLQERTAEETLAQGEHIAAALSSFAKQRGDIFGSTEEEEQQLKTDTSKAGTAPSQHSEAMPPTSAPPQPPSSYPPPTSHAPPPMPPSYPPPSGMPPAMPPSGMPPSMPPGPPPMGMPPMGMPPMGMPPMGMPPQGMPPPSMGMPPQGMPPPSMGMPPYGGPPAPGIPPPPPAEDTSKPKIDPATGLMPEADYKKLVSGPVSVMCALPNDESNPQFNGQMVTVTVDISISIKDLKSKLSADHLGGLPPNKYQLRFGNLGFLKDRLTVAHYNMKNGDVVQLQMRTRGGGR